MTEIAPYKRKTYRTPTNKKPSKKSKTQLFLKFIKRPDLWVNAALGFLLARGLVFGELLPFGTAFFAATVIRRPVLLWPVGIAVAAGTASVVGGYALLGVVMSMIVLTVLLRALKKGDSWLLSAAVVLTGTAVVKACILSLGSPELYEGAKAILEIMLATVLTMVFMTFFKGIERIRSLKDLSTEEFLCVIILAAGLFNGMNEMQYSGISMNGLLGKFAILIAAGLGGSGAGAAVGIFLGFVPSIGTAGMPGLAGMLGFSGMTAGLFRRLGKITVAASFLLSTMLTTYFFVGESEVVSTISETGLAILLFLLFPLKIFDDLRQKTSSALSGSRSSVLDFASVKVKGLAEIFTEIADSYHHAATLDNDQGNQDVPSLMNIIADRVCANCPVVKVCWEKDFYKTYKNMLDIFSAVEAKGTLQAQDLPVELRRQCGRIKEMILAVNFIFDNQRMNRNWTKKHTENREMISAQLHGVSGMMSSLAGEFSLRACGQKTEKRAKARRRRNFLEIGVASAPKTGNLICGDCYASVPIGDEKHAVILSDGMGVGEKAAKESTVTLSLLEQLLRNGFEADAAVKTLNSMLVLRSPEETFATVDIALFDLQTDKVEFIKVGSAPSYLKQKDNIEVVTANSLPVGILNTIEVEMQSRDLMEGDTLIMITDGVLDVLKGAPNDWVKEYMRESGTTNAQILAEELVVRAKSLGQGILGDDMIVLVVKKGYWG